MLPIGSRKEIDTFLSKIEIRKINGIGKITSALLNSIDIHTCSDLLKNRSVLYLLEYSSTFRFLMQVAIGYDNISLHKSEDSVSKNRTIGQEITFTSTSNLKNIRDILDNLCIALEDELKSQNILATKIILKLKTSKFQTITRTKSLENPINDSTVFFNVSTQMLDEFKSIISRDSVRLIGVRAMYKNSTSHCLCGPLSRYISKTYNQLKDDNKVINEPTHAKCDTFVYNTKAREIPKLDDDIVLENHNMILPQNYERDAAATTICPVCFKFEFINMTITDINNHIDECLTFQLLTREKLARKSIPSKLIQTSLHTLLSSRK